MDSSSKIIIVDDNLLYREGMKFLIEMEGMGKVIAEAANGQVFLDILEDHIPDLVLMDIDMPVMGGLEASIKAMALRPYLKILVLTMMCGTKEFADLANAGVMGFVLKTSGKQTIEEAIKTVIAGDCFFSNEILHQINK